MDKRKIVLIKEKGRLKRKAPAQKVEGEVEQKKERLHF